MLCYKKQDDIQNAQIILSQGAIQLRHNRAFVPSHVLMLCHKVLSFVPESRLSDNVCFAMSSRNRSLRFQT